MTGYNNFPGPQSSVKVGVIGNEADDIPDDNSGNQKIYNPLLHSSSGVPSEHLMFSGLMQSPTQWGQSSFPGALDPGTMIYYLAQEGMNGGIIIGHGNSTNKGGGGGGNQTVKNLKQSKRNINVPPEIEEGEERGAKVRKIKEKGEQHRLELLDGIPVNGALFDMSGFRLPDLKKIPTAKKHGSKMQQQDMLNQLMGQVQSVGGMLKGLAGKGGGGAGSNLGGLAGTGTFSGQQTNGFQNIGGQTQFYTNTAISGIVSNGVGAAGWGNVENRLSSIIEKLPDDMKSALKNYATLVQGLDTSNGLAFFSGNIVHPETFLNNAEDLLSQVTNISDLLAAFRQLETDTTLFGQEYLTKVNVVLETAWGNAKKTIDIDGNVTIEYTDEAKKAIADFESMLEDPELGAGFGSRPAERSSLTLRGDGVTKNFNIGSEFNGKELSVYIDGVVILDTKFTIFSTQNAASTTTTVSVNTTTTTATTTIPTVATVPSTPPVVKLSIQFNTAPNNGSIIFIAGINKTAAANSNTSSSGSGTSGGGSGGSGGSGGGGEGGGGAGQNIMGQMFGKSSKVVQDMMKRLSQTGEQESRKLTEKLNKDQKSKKLLEVAKKIVNEGNPLDKSLYQ